MRFCLNMRGHDYAVLKVYDETIRGNNPSESFLAPLFKSTLAGRGDHSGMYVRQAVDGICKPSLENFIGDLYQSGKIRY